MVRSFILFLKAGVPKRRICFGFYTYIITISERRLKASVLITNHSLGCIKISVTNSSREVILPHLLSCDPRYSSLSRSGVLSTGKIIHLFELVQRRAKKILEGWNISVRKGWESWGCSGWKRKGSRGPSL